MISFQPEHVSTCVRERRQEVRKNNEVIKVDLRYVKQMNNNRKASDERGWKEGKKRAKQRITIVKKSTNIENRGGIHLFSN